MNNSVIDFLDQIKIAKFTVIYKVGAKGLNLPEYKGSTFRGAFGHVFKELFCSCGNIEYKGIHRSDCIYGYVFETRPHEGSEVFSKYESIPRPFILEPPLDERQIYYPGERILLDLVLIGKGIQYFPYFVAALKIMGEKGLGKGKLPLTLIQVFIQDEKGNLFDCVYNNKEEKLKKINSNTNNLFLSNKENQLDILINKLSVVFITPTRMKWQSSYIKEPEFHIVIRNTVRRVTSILYFHHEILMDIDYHELFDNAQKIQMTKREIVWVDWERYSNRQNEKIKLGGIIGKAVYRGDLNPFFPWLLAGEALHIGKNTVFGLGKISIQSDYNV